MNTFTVVPIDNRQQQQVADRTAELIIEAESLFGVCLPILPVRFNLRGRAAGMFRSRGGENEIRYNPWLFSRYFAENMAETIPHEVAHYVVFKRHGNRRVRPHGQEWQEVMGVFGVEPRATCDFDLNGIPRRRLRQFTYRCDCRTHRLSTIRHNRVISDQRRYSCRFCGQPLRAVC